MGGVLLLRDFFKRYLESVPLQRLRARLFRAGVSVAILLGAFVITAAAQNRTGQTTDNGKAWIGARIIDGSGRPPLENATLYIRNGRIEAVGKHMKLPASVQTPSS